MSTHPDAAPAVTERIGLLAVLEAKPDRVPEVEAFLTSALSLAQAEPQTVRWYALRLDDTRFAVFDTFADEAGRKAHLAGQIARDLFAHADTLLATPPHVEFIDLLAVK